MQDKLLTTTEAARLMNCCRNHVKKLLDTGELKGRQVGRFFFVEADSVEAILSCRKAVIDSNLATLRNSKGAA